MRKCSVAAHELSLMNAIALYRYPFTDCCEQSYLLAGREIGQKKVYFGPPSASVRGRRGGGIRRDERGCAHHPTHQGKVRQGRLRKSMHWSRIIRIRTGSFSSSWKACAICAWLVFSALCVVLPEYGALRETLETPPVSNAYITFCIANRLPYSESCFCFPLVLRSFGAL